MIRKLINGPGLSLLDQGIVSTGNFLSIIIASKILSASQFGVYVISITTIFIATGLMNSLVANTMRFHGVGLDGKKLNIYVTENIVYLTLLAIPVAIGILIFLPEIIDVSYIDAMYTALTFLCFQLHDISRVVRSIQFDWLTLLLSDVTLHSIRIIIFFLFWKIEILDIRSALLIYALASLISVITTRFLARIQAVNLQHLSATIKQAWKFGKWLLGESIVYALSTQIYVILIGMFLNTTLAGVYGAIQQLLNVINIIHVGLMNYISPSMKRKLNINDYNGWARLGIKSSIVMFTTTLFIVGILSIYAKEIIQYLYTDSMAEYSEVLYIFSLSVLTASINAVLNICFRTSNQPQMGLKVKIISAFITVIVSYPLIKYWGVYGAAIGVVVTQVSWLLMYIHEIQANRKLSFNHVTKCLSES